MPSTSKAIDWDLLIEAGVPLLSSRRDSTMIDWPSVASAATFATKMSLTEREEIALRSWLIAIRDHYSSTFNLHFNSDSIADFINARLIDGRVIKLRRLAMSRLAKIA